MSTSLPTQVLWCRLDRSVRGRAAGLLRGGEGSRNKPRLPSLVPVVAGVALPRSAANDETTLRVRKF